MQMENTNTYPEQIKDLPIYPHLDDICHKLKSSASHFMVLNAETAAGKSTAMPLALLKNFGGKIYMLEGRRIAALNVASRVASLLNEPCGKTSGYEIHLEKKSSESTRFTVMTEAIFIRKLQADPELDGVNVVVLDEFHERSLYTDLALTFLKEAMVLRDDLYVIVMSATINSEKLISYLGGKQTVPFYYVEGRNFPVEIQYMGTDSIEKAVEKIICTCDGYSSGDVLVFLPGIREINRVRLYLENLNLEEEILVLHSMVSFEEQKKVLSKGTDSRRRVILSTSIAETSLTIPGVTVVVDSGLSRYNMHNQNSGMEFLVTRIESEFNAAQRAGRAGRVQKGKCVRLWNESEKRIAENVPEILRADLSALVLECAEWGFSNFEEIDWLDKPSKNNVRSAIEFLKMLGCLSEDGNITDLGKACLKTGVGIRSACIALSGTACGKEKFSTEYAAKIECRLTGTDSNFVKQVQNLQKRVQICKDLYSFSSLFPPLKSEFSTGFALLCGYPDRLGKKIGENYQFYSGKQAKVLESKGSRAGEYIVALDVNSGTDIANIMDFENIENALAEEFMALKAVKRTNASFVKGTNQISKSEDLCFGQIVLKSTKMPVEKDDFLLAWKNKVCEEGLDSLPLEEKTQKFLKRAKFLCEKKSAESAELFEKIEGLSENVDEWLFPFCSENKITEQNVHEALRWYLEGTKIDTLVPEVLVLANGFKCKIQYEEQNGCVIPVAEIIIQKIFGCFSTPEILGVPVLLRLLSPARRPLQVTQDLENFWKNTWPEICSEMKGRYPKHNWDYRIADVEE